MVRSLGLAAVSMAGLLVLANSGATQERREGATRREGEARQGEARREGEARRDEGRAGSISREDRLEGEGRFYDRGYYDGGYYGYNRGNWGYYGPYRGYGFSGPRYYNYGWSSPYSTYGYGSNGYYYGSTYGAVIDDCQSSGVKTNKADSGMAYGSLGNISDKALISVKVPPDAKVNFDDFKTAQTGANRQFITPALEANHDFSYTVHARWMEGDKPIDQTRKVTVHAGGRATIDFTAPASEGPEARHEDIAAPKRGEEKPQAKQEEKPLAKPEAKPLAKQEEKPLAKEEKPQAKPEEKQSAATKTHEGQVVSFSNHELVMKGSDGKEHTHTLANDAKVTIDGKPAKPEDLKANMKIEVTTKEGDAKTALRIEAHSK